MTERDLLKRIAELETRNFELFEENERLREILGLPQTQDAVTLKKEDTSVQYIVDTVTTPSINKYSTPDEKIELFQSLFRGRTDVYAKRCYSNISPQTREYPID
jgi:hypothetical protein